MIILLPLLMAYMLIGENVHECLGIFMGIFFLVHNALNYRWYLNLFRGRYSPLRCCRTLVNALLLILMMGSLGSGIVMSKYVFAGLGFEKGMAAARIVHLFCAYWGFAFMNIHLGMHGNMVRGVFSTTRSHKAKSTIRSVAVRLPAAAIAAYGFYTIIKTNVISYMFLKNTFVFFDPERSFSLFLAEYLSMMGFWIFIGFGCSRVLSAIPLKLKG